MLKEIDNVGIAVGNLKRSVDFYHDKLGLELLGGYQEGAEGASVKIGSSSLYLFQIKKKNPRPVRRTADHLNDPVGLDHISFGVDNVDEVYQGLQAKGVSFLVRPTTVESWGMRYAGIKDPDGNILYFVQRLG